MALHHLPVFDGFRVITAFPFGVRHRYAEGIGGLLPGPMFMGQVRSGVLGTLLGIQSSFRSLSRLALMYSMMAYDAT